MPQHYSNPKRASETYALPDVETFYCDGTGHNDPGSEEGLAEPGWYYWFCLPGCLPDSGPMGPFDSEAEALADAREGMDDDESEEDDAH